MLTCEPMKNDFDLWVSQLAFYHKTDCSVHEPSARCSCGIHKLMTQFRAERQDVLAALSALKDDARWVPWEVGKPLPTMAMYLVTLDDGFLAICPGDAFEKEFVVAYWAEPLPAPVAAIDRERK